jgi:uncharacterized protein YbbC (DUF1343 family)
MIGRKIPLSMIRFVLIFVFLSAFQCSHTVVQSSDTDQKNVLQVGADQVGNWYKALQGKRIGLVVNHTAMVGNTHLADTLIKLNVQLVKIFSPEHGFRGTADAGEKVNDDVDSKTGLPVVSLYGNNKKPTTDQLANIDILLFDIQDVGARFYTYISTLHYVMEACAENSKKLVVLDRPNPNGDYVDGPVLKPEFKSFVGMHPIPIVHGLTIGELATMINEEGWLSAGKKCELEVLKIKNWKHKDFYSLPVKPSPNLPTDQAIQLYPSLCLFEGTVISVGRGTRTPFEIIGHPSLKNMPYQFTPVSIEGMSKNPPYENQVCYGVDLQKVAVRPFLDLSYLTSMYESYPDKDKFFNSFFDKLAGNSDLKQQIKNGWNEAQIRQSWKKELEQYSEIRKKYLLYL